MKSNKNCPYAIRRLGVLCVAALLPITAQAQADVSNLIDLLDNTPEGSWVKANTNLISNVWTPSALRPLLNDGRNPDPTGVIGAWSSFAWDSTRGDLLIFGGGHANYAGNEVYKWRGATRQWERASLPSEVKQDDMRNWVAFDGPLNAPSSAHTYDNSVYLPIVDRFLTFGGAAHNNGSSWEMATSPTTERRTGPYLFDPSKADPNKVGGSTGSHVKRVNPYPDIVGSNAWTNRDFYSNANLTGLPYYFVNGCTAYAQEDGKDVIFVGNNTGGGTSLNLHKYTINDLNNPLADTWQVIGAWWEAASDQTACAYDPVRKILLRTGSDSWPFVYWDTSKSGWNNLNVKFKPTDPTGEFPTLLAGTNNMMYSCGLDFDPLLNKFALWCGDGRVWMVTPPAALSANGWTIEKQPTPQGFVPDTPSSTGVLGKWKFISNLNAFMGLQKAIEGNVWIYKPVGWQRPGGGTANQLPQVSITSPGNGAQFDAGNPITIDAEASDSDGTIVLVEFFDGNTKIGEDASEPYSLTWNGATVGNRVLKATATDDRGGKRTSNSVTITVNGAGGTFTLVLQDGVNSYTGTRDANPSSWHKTRKTGVASQFLDQNLDYTILVKFAIFESEGGPVPNNATIDSAKFSIYKSTVYETNYNLHRMLVPWDEANATWLERSTGIVWGSGGGNAAGVDYLATADATLALGWNPGWATFDVTSGVQAMKSSNINHGWRLRRTSGGSALKYFHSREYTTNPALRPKLEVTFTSN